jgi:hypothetical protein
MMSVYIEPVGLGIRFPRATLDKLDKYKGYHSRNSFLLKIVDEYLNKLEKGELQNESDK